MSIISTLSNLAQSDADAVKEWFEQAFQETPALFYSSVDLRHSGTKLAPVDTNLFPAGFNNLSKASQPIAADTIREMVRRRFPDATKLLLLPENHTRNQGYIDNLCYLIHFVEEAGLEVKLGRLFPDDTSEEEQQLVELTTTKGKVLRSVPIVRKGDRVITEDGFEPDIILVNNDLTSGAPKILCGIEQAVMPPTGLGWYRRRKSVYFDAYDRVCAAFGEAFNIDPWLLSTYTHQCGTINFKERKGIECVALGVEKVIHRLRAKYEAYGIEEEPYVFIKADSGTYGMGIMTARSGDELFEMNKKARNKMNIVKEGAVNSEVIIQEGIPTVDTRTGAVAEPAVYLIDGKPIGGFWRVNEGRGAYQNLNASGMHFEPMSAEVSSSSNASEPELNAYHIVARLAALAASREEYATPHPCEKEAS